MDSLFTHILRQFQLPSPVISCKPYGCGHINKTYLVTTQAGIRYILQKIGPAFKNIDSLQENIFAVTEHLRTKVNDHNEAMTMIPTVDGQTYYHHEENSNWRMYKFIEGGICLQAAECPLDFYQSAIAFGTFQQQMADFPAEKLHETIPHFHDTPDRYRIFRETIAKDPVGRVAEVQAEIDFALAREETAGKLVSLLQAGELPLRVTHNDTKLNNVMFREKDHTPLCVMDLDTTMPGLSAYDYGDAIRFGASTAAEDEKDLDKVTMDLELFRLFTKGYLEACPGLTEKEREVLPLPHSPPFPSHTLFNPTSFLIIIN